MHENKNLSSYIQNTIHSVIRSYKKKKNETHFQNVVFITSVKIIQKYWKNESVQYKN